MAAATDTVMPLSMLSPFDLVKPGQLLTQYADWIYFTLILIFFIAVAGLTLRKHFDQPYVKPLIIAVGLMLTVAVFLKREWLRMLFDGWGVVGAILLVIVVAVIPYGLARGFGLAAGKAFYVTYILFYILSWVKFSSFYTGLAEYRMGFVNLGLLIFFIFAVYQVLPFGHSSKISIPRLSNIASANLPAIERDIETQKAERKAMTNQAWPLTKQEIRTVEDMAEALAEIQQMIERGHNNMSTEDRIKVGNILRQIARRDSLFKNDLAKMQKLIARITKIDAEELDKMRKRVSAAPPQEKETLRAEIHREEQKLQAEKTVIELEQRLGRGIEAFSQGVGEAVTVIGQSAYPLDAKPLLARCRQILKGLIEILQELKRLEGRVVNLSKNEKELLKHEKKVAG